MVCRQDTLASKKIASERMFQFQCVQDQQTIQLFYLFLCRQMVEILSRFGLTVFNREIKKGTKTHMGTLVKKGAIPFVGIQVFCFFCAVLHIFLRHWAAPVAEIISLVG